MLFNLIDLGLLRDYSESVSVAFVRVTLFMQHCDSSYYTAVQRLSNGYELNLVSAARTAEGTLTSK